MIGLEQIDTLKYGADGLLPVVAQDETTGAVLMLAYANREALRQTLSTGRAFYYSRSQRELWQKGETSGHFQYITDVRTDCDGDAVLYTVRQQGVACHTGAYSCFGAADTRNGAAPADTLRALQTTVQDRRDRPKEGSYTNYLFDKGLDKILKKVGEETAEVIIAAKNQSADELRYETADLCYHLTVLLTQAGLSWEDITGELRRREEK